MPQNFDLMEDAIGNGAFGVVHMAHDFTSNKNVALKIIPKRTVLKNGSIQNVRAEVEIQTSLNHERIVKCFGYFERKESITLVLEYAAHGNLRAYMKDCKDEKIPIAQVQCLIRQVTSALSHLESRYVAHRDVKSENVLISKHDGRNLEVKLCDFGYATKYTLDDDMQRTMVGTPEFIPPEMILDTEYMARHVDPWALGVLAYELALGRSPFYVATREMKQIAKERYYEKSYHVIYDLIVNFTVLERPCECENDEFFEFVRCLLQLEPFDRWSATEALGHSWLQSEAEEERAMKRIKVKISEAV
jgi:serine/threonine protein kinase